jgi:hypothetical protein
VNSQGTDSRPICRPEDLPALIRLLQEAGMCRGIVPGDARPETVQEVEKAANDLLSSSISRSEICARLGCSDDVLAGLISGKQIIPVLRSNDLGLGERFAPGTARRVLARFGSQLDADRQSQSEQMAVGAAAHHLGFAESDVALHVLQHPHLVTWLADPPAYSSLRVDLGRLAKSLARFERTLTRIGPDLRKELRERQKENRERKPKAVRETKLQPGPATRHLAMNAEVQSHELLPLFHDIGLCLDVELNPDGVLDWGNLETKLSIEKAAKKVLAGKLPDLATRAGICEQLGCSEAVLDKFVEEQALRPFNTSNALNLGDLFKTEDGRRLLERFAQARQRSRSSREAVTFAIAAERLGYSEADVAAQVLSHPGLITRLPKRLSCDGILIDLKALGLSLRLSGRPMTEAGRERLARSAQEKEEKRAARKVEREQAARDRLARTAQAESERQERKQVRIAQQEQAARERQARLERLLLEEQEGQATWVVAARERQANREREAQERQARRERREQRAVAVLKARLELTARKKLRSRRARRRAAIHREEATHKAELREAAQQARIEEHAREKLARWLTRLRGPAARRLMSDRGTEPAGLVPLLHEVGLCSDVAVEPDGSPDWLNEEVRSAVEKAAKKVLGFDGRLGGLLSSEVACQLIGCTIEIFDRFVGDRYLHPAAPNNALGLGVLFKEADVLALLRKLGSGSPRGVFRKMVPMTFAMAAERLGCSEADVAVEVLKAPRLVTRVPHPMSFDGIWVDFDLLSDLISGSMASKAKRRGSARPEGSRRSGGVDQTRPKPTTKGTEAPKRRSAKQAPRDLVTLARFGTQAVLSMSAIFHLVQQGEIPVAPGDRKAVSRSVAERFLRRFVSLPEVLSHWRGGRQIADALSLARIAPSFPIEDVGVAIYARKYVTTIAEAFGEKGRQAPQL